LVNIEGEACSIISISKKKLKENNHAISETFTVLPSLAMILIGFTIFSIVIATAYTTFDTKQTYIDKFEISDMVLEKICSPNAVFTDDSNLINVKTFNSEKSKDYISQLQDTYELYSYSLAVKVAYKNTECWVPAPISPEKIGVDIFASSKQVSVVLNEVTTIPGRMTVFIWIEQT
jgi:hypothetical protein